MVSTPVARRRSALDTATPMVLVPRSRPTRAPRSGHCVAASVSGRIRAGIASLTMRALFPAKQEGSPMDVLTLFGLFAVTAMLACYALEERSHGSVVVFAAAWAPGSASGSLQGAWPFGLVEAVWAVVALRRWNVRR